MKKIITVTLMAALFIIAGCGIEKLPVSQTA
jgi:predicted small lipoprotein YifL